jgi:hypothetical protein
MAAERSAKAGAFRDEIAYASVGESLASMTAPQAAAQAAEVGEVFQYQLKEPISIARQRSAMLPILASAIEGRRVSIYSRSDGSEHPMRGVEIRNSTGLQLMPGPISVFDSTAYAGDAQIGHVPSGDKRLLAYAVDLDVRALVKDESNSSLQTVRIVDGLLEQTFKEQATVTYAFSSKDAKRPRTILVEHPKLPGDWTLVDGMKPIEETQTLRRFEVAVEPAGKATLKIAAERVNASRIGLLDFDAGTLLALSKNGKVSAAVIDAFKKAASLRAAANSTKEKIAQLDQERGGIDQDQTRIRQNIASVGRETDLYRRYTAKLNEQETRLEQIREQRAAQQSQLEKQEEALREFLRGLNVE